MTGHRKWGDIYAEALASGRITEEGVKRARKELLAQIEVWDNEALTSGEPCEKIDG
jgi:hypothetical protein